MTPHVRTPVDNFHRAFGGLLRGSGCNGWSVCRGAQQSVCCQPTNPHGIHPGRQILSGVASEKREASQSCQEVARALGHRHGLVKDCPPSVGFREGLRLSRGSRQRTGFWGKGSGWLNRPRHEGERHTGRLRHLPAANHPYSHACICRCAAQTVIDEGVSTEEPSLGNGLAAKAVAADPTASGKSIRQRFLQFFEKRGHKILPSSSLVPKDPTVLLTIAGMLQFKPIFLGQEPRQVERATTSQKCIRTNDVENVGRTARHHTFFEMLGNFSFGDYFKKEAIQWAWELATQEFKLPVERLWVSVFEDDDESFLLWRDMIGVPEERIQRMGADDNFWASGPTGPCGPCSEMYYDFHPERGTSGATLEDDSRFIEFYNLVFMQFNRTESGELLPLKNKYIDTGLGLERMAQILQEVPSNYETDLIYPVMHKAASMAGIDYERSSDDAKMKLKVIGDHMRAVVYLISDGVVPSNIGRGYVARRLVRRAVRMGRLLGIKGEAVGDQEGGFLPALAEVVVKMSRDVDPDVEKNATRIQEELKREEMRFVQTLERGEKLLEELLIEAVETEKREKSGKPCLSGKDVFLLYDTFGFPVEITTEVALERGVEVDMEGFKAEMEIQRKQSQVAHAAIKLAVGSAAADLAETLPSTEFVGYDELQVNARVTAIISGGEAVSAATEGNVVDIVLDRTPFYAESGGQIGDHGILEVRDINGAGGGRTGEPMAVLKVKDVQKAAGGDLFIHRATVEKGAVTLGASVQAAVDPELRSRAQAHHTATHLLQAALKQVLGEETAQAGSLVAFDRLRFDFNSPRGLTDDEIVRIEGLVNDWIGRAVPLESSIMGLTEAKNAGAIAMFGEKYGEEVRVVTVPEISMELCGGTHVKNTAEIRGLKIISEAGIASGVRRIEAVAGPGVLEYLDERDRIVRHLSSQLKVKAEEVALRVADLQEEARASRNEVAELKAALAVTKAELLADQAEVIGGNFKVIVAPLEAVDPESLRLAAERLLQRLGDPAAVVLGSIPEEGKVSLVAAFSDSVLKYGIQAGKFIGPVAKVCGGGGGGRPNIAQAGGRLPEKLLEALELAKSDLQSAIIAKNQ